MDDREWARLESRLQRIEAAVGIVADPVQVESDANLILKGRLMGWAPGCPMPERTPGLPDPAARWLAGSVPDGMGP
jgi:hypothetical protein